MLLLHSSQADIGSVRPFNMSFFSPPEFLAAFLASWGAGLDVDDPIMQNVVLDTMLPVAPVRDLTNDLT